MKLEEIFSFENLYHAYTCCRKAKQHKGEVIRFETDLAHNLSTLHHELVTKKYKLGKYKEFLIYEPKERWIEALSFKSRVVVRCFCDVCLRPKIEKTLIYDNAACRKNKGTTFAINRLHQFLRKEYRKKGNNTIYFLKCDIHKYFPSIHHEILLQILEKMDFSEGEMWVNRMLIKEQPNGKDRGLPLGNQSSQWFALLYLNKVDHYIKEQLRIKHYVRYMDDMVLIHSDKSYLVECKKKIERFCKEQLDLALNQKTQIGRMDNGVDFLGYRHILNTNGKVIVKLRHSARQRMKKHVKTIYKLYRKGWIDDTYVYVRKNAFYNHIKNTQESLRFKKVVFAQM